MYLYQTEVQLNETLLLVGWNVLGDYFPATKYQPAEEPEIDWVLLVGEHEKLTPQDEDYIENILYCELKAMEEEPEEIFYRDDDFNYQPKSKPRKEDW